MLTNTIRSFPDLDLALGFISQQPRRLRQLAATKI